MKTMRKRLQQGGKWFTVRREKAKSQDGGDTASDRRGGGVMGAVKGEVNCFYIYSRGGGLTCRNKLKGQSKE